MFLKVVYPVKQVLEVDGLNPTAETILLGILTLYLQQLSTHEFLTTLIEPLDPKQPEELEQQDNTASLTTEASPFLRLRPQEIISNLDKLEDSRQLNQMLANMRPTLVSVFIPWRILMKLRKNQILLWIFFPCLH